MGKKIKHDLTCNDDKDTCFSGGGPEQDEPTMMIVSPLNTAFTTALP